MWIIKKKKFFGVCVLENIPKWLLLNEIRTTFNAILSTWNRKLLINSYNIHYLRVKCYNISELLYWLNKIIIKKKEQKVFKKIIIVIIALILYCFIHQLLYLILFIKINSVGRKLTQNMKIILNKLSLKFFNISVHIF